MANETDKFEQEEKPAFVRFYTLAGLAIDPQSIQKGDSKKNEPDILCKDVHDQPFAFELKEVVAPEFAVAIKDAAANDKCVSDAVWGQDTMDDVIKNALERRLYSVNCTVDLLVYCNGRSAMSLSIIVPRIRSLATNGLGPFRCVWAMANDTACLVLPVENSLRAPTSKGEMSDSPRGFACCECGFRATIVPLPGGLVAQVGKAFQPGYDCLHDQDFVRCPECGTKNFVEIDRQDGHGARIRSLGSKLP